MYCKRKRIYNNVWGGAVDGIYCLFMKGTNYKSFPKILDPIPRMRIPFNQNFESTPEQKPIPNENQFKLLLPCDMDGSFSLVAVIKAVVGHSS